MLLSNKSFVLAQKKQEAVVFCMRFCMIQSLKIIISKPLD